MMEANGGNNDVRGVGERERVKVHYATNAPFAARKVVVFHSVQTLRKPDAECLGCGGVDFRWVLLGPP